MLTRGESHACPEVDKQNMLASLNRYLHMMREYYETEVRICNVLQEREKVARQLITLSQSFDLELFRVTGESLVLKLRMLTV